MKQHDDDVSGPHRSRLHFFAGLVFGAFLGGYWFGDLFENGRVAAAVIGCVSLATAFFCGRWGEPAWRRIADWLGRWWARF